MKLDALYKALVVGGSALVMSCAATSTGDSGAKRPTADPKLEECRKVCNALPSGETFCPDPVLKQENCCWLMSPRMQPCCDIDHKDLRKR